jgi:hypothetical protein
LVDKAYFDKVASDWVVKCENEIRTWDRYEKFKLGYFRRDWSISRRSSRGGWYRQGPGINIAMSRYCFDFILDRVYEYPSFDADPVIGGFVPKHKDHYLACVVCHEMAHAAQFYAYNILNAPKGAPHGPDFRQPYARLRKKLFNHLL